MPAHHSTTVLQSLIRTAETLTRGRDGERYVDFGVEIRTVEKDPSGGPPAPGLPDVVEIGEPLYVGGRLDTLTRRYVGPCHRWRVWLVGEQQRAIIEDFVAGRGPRNRLLYSAEGGGKTVLMGMLGWLAIMLATAAGSPGALGATAPTHARLGTLQTSLCDLGPVSSSREHVPGSWGTFFSDAGDLVTVSGHVIQFRSTKIQSGAVGSPIQGWNWGLGALMDEIQDSIHAYPDVVARLRAGKNPPIFGTATAKDNSAWREFRDQLNPKNWVVARLPYTATPFVHDSHWELLQDECSEREWQRRGLALDVGPERMTYHTWLRSENLCPVPEIGVEDVTAEVLRPWGENLGVLVGHDPGKLFDVSVLLKAYRRFSDNQVLWWVVDEVTTRESTTEGHIEALLTTLRTKWGCNRLDWRGNRTGGKQALVRADPYSDSGSDANRPDRSVYTLFRREGLRILPAALKAAVSEVKVGRVPREARINMVCRLLCDMRGRRRLMVAVGPDRRPVAPNLVNALESQERDAAGDAERQRKDIRDTSHWSAAVGYALWAIERPRTGEGVAS